MRGHRKAEGLWRKISKASSEECVSASVLPGEASLAQERTASAKHFCRTPLAAGEVRNVGPCDAACPGLDTPVLVWLGNSEETQDAACLVEAWAGERL